MLEEKNCQNGDALYKALARTYKGKRFYGCGIYLPPIQELLPPIPVDDGFIDSLFLLTDGTYVFVDYTSECCKAHMARYPKYIAKIMEKYDKEDSDFDLRLIIVYTGDVEKADPVFDCGCLILRPEQVFLSQMEGREILDAVRHKIHSGLPLTDYDLMDLVILPLTAPGSEGKKKMFDKVAALAEQIPDGEQRTFILSGATAACSKFINIK